MPFVACVFCSCPVTRTIMGCDKSCSRPLSLSLMLPRSHSRRLRRSVSWRLIASWAVSCTRVVARNGPHLRSVFTAKQQRAYSRCLRSQVQFLQSTDFFYSLFRSALYAVAAIAELKNTCCKIQPKLYWITLTTFSGEASNLAFIWSCFSVTFVVLRSLAIIKRPNTAVLKPRSCPPFTSELLGSYLMSL